MVKKKEKTEKKTKSKTRSDKNTPRSMRKKVTWRDIYTLLKVEKEKGELTKKEKDRLKIFKEKKAKLDAMCTNECKVCKMKIPPPIEFCGSEHRREWEEKHPRPKCRDCGKRPTDRGYGGRCYFCASKLPKGKEGMLGGKTKKPVG